MPLRLSADHVEDIRRLGIYLGPVVLASILGNVVYDAVFPLTPAAIGGGMPLFLHLALAMVGAIVTWQMTDPLGQIAWAVVTIRHVVQVVGALLQIRIDNFWSDGLISLFALLATASGARGASRRTLWIAGGVFLVAVAWVFAARYYADELLGNHSIMSAARPFPEDGTLRLTSD